MEQEVKKAGHVVETVPADVIAALIESTEEQTHNLPTIPEDAGSDSVISKLLTMDNVTQQVAKLLAEGQSPKTISIIVDLPVSTVIKLSRQKNVREYIKDFHDEIGMLEKSNRELLLSQILEARLANLGEGEDMSALSNKDTLDIIDSLDRLQKEREKAELGSSGNMVINVLQAIKK